MVDSRHQEQEEERLKEAESKLRIKVEDSLDVLEQAGAALRGLDAVRETLAETVVENLRLRRDNVRLAQALVRRTAAPSDSGEVESVLAASAKEVQVAQIQVADLLDENTELQSRVLDLEELNGSMMSMYVSSYQLHATLDLDEVVRVVEEILVNFIGAKSFCVLLAEETGLFRVAAEKGLDGRLPGSGIDPRGVLAEVVGSRNPYVDTSRRPAREGILAAVPLIMGSNCVGALVVYSLYSQKEQLLRNDVELLSLLGGHAASAVVSARLYARADRKLKTLEGMLSLLGGDDE
ncbi:MAG: hypothetical protein GY822_27070 [Deltaproteobacteria bacterium]|nr:hypothetical protein [Deltaproteobacteria bacterium]